MLASESCTLAPLFILRVDLVVEILLLLDAVERCFGFILGDIGGAGRATETENVATVARELERQEQSLTRTLSQQQGVLAEQERAFREIAASANFAESAVAQYGDEAERSGLRAALIDREAAEALDEQAAAARRVAAARAEAAQVKFNEINGVTVDPRGAQAAESANVFVESFQRQEEAVRRLQERINPLVAIERKLSAETKLLSNAFKSGTIGPDEYADALNRLEIEAQQAREALDRVGRGEKGKIGLFGLKPYELTNLGYQVNDLVTQIASGTSPLQAFAQQGGQILQILPRIGARLVAVFSNPYYLAAAVVFGGIALSIKEASDQAERLRKVEGLLTITGEAAGVTAQELAAVAQEIERIGFTAEESLDLVRTFLTQGLATSVSSTVSPTRATSVCLVATRMAVRR